MEYATPALPVPTMSPLVVFVGRVVHLHSLHGDPVCNSSSGRPRWVGDAPRGTPFSCESRASPVRVAVVPTRAPSSREAMDNLQRALPSVARPPRTTAPLVVEQLVRLLGMRLDTQADLQTKSSPWRPNTRLENPRVGGSIPPLGTAFNALRGTAVSNASVASTEPADATRRGLPFASPAQLTARCKVSIFSWSYDLRMEFTE